jgi:hypothetical protein
MPSVYCYNRTEAVQLVTLFVQDEVNNPWKQGETKRKEEKIPIKLVRRHAPIQQTSMACTQTYA